MSEGYVDGTKTAESNCANGTTKLIDYTYENLCYQAFGQRSLTIQPLSLRSDAAAGFGPYPNTKCYADTYNQFVYAINLLTRVRVMLPWVLETNVQTIANSILLAATDSNGCSSAQDCTEGVGLMSWQGQPASATTVVSESGWGEFSSYAFAQTSAAITETCSDLNYILESYRVVTQWRFAHFDADQTYAIPELWRDMVSTNLGTLWTDEVIHTVEKPIAGAYDCNGTTFTCDWTTDETLHETSCIVSASGVADQGATPDYGWVWFASNTAFPPTVCNGGPSRVEYLVPVDPTQVLLQVTLTDWTGEE